MAGGPRTTSADSPPLRFGERLNTTIALVLAYSPWKLSHSERNWRRALRSGLSDGIRSQNFAKPPRTIISDLHAQVDVPGSQLGSYAIVDVTMQVEYTWFQGNDWAVREDQL